MADEAVVIVDPTPAVVQVREQTTEVVQVSLGGIPGPRGVPGPPGNPATVTEQHTPAGTWVVPHTLNRLPAVAVYDAGGQQILPDSYVTTNSVTLVFAEPTAGTAVLI